MKWTLPAAVILALTASSLPTHAQGCKPQRAESDVARVRLSDSGSSAKIFGDTEAMQTLQDKDANGQDQYFPYVRFLSQDGRQEARFYIHYGSSVGEYNEIAVMPATPAGTAKTLPVTDFATERGVRLGMAEADLVRMLGSCHKVTTEADGIRRISYEIADEKHALLKRTGMPGYFAHYDFRGGRLEKFRIGLEYP